MPGRAVRPAPGGRVREAASLDPKTALSGLGGDPTSHSPAQWRKQSSAGLNPAATLATLPAVPTRKLRRGRQAALTRPQSALAGGPQNRTAPPRFGRQPLRWGHRVLCDPGITSWLVRADRSGSVGQQKRGSGSAARPHAVVVCYRLLVVTCCRTAAIPEPSSTASIMASQPMHELIIMWYSRRSAQSRS
jgi:hypothetical protein